MKNKLFYFLVSITSLFGSGGLSCSPCSDMECGKNGACDEADGKCFCIVGYEISSWGVCDSLSNTKFIGTYNAVDICAGFGDPYIVSIKTSNISINSIILTKFGGYQSGTLDLEVLATVERNKLEIADQKIPFDGHEYHIYATSTVMTEAGKIMLPYKIAIDGMLDTDCTMQLTKQ